MPELFGYSIKRAEQERGGKKSISPVPPNEDDGQVSIAAGGHYGYFVDLEGGGKNEQELLRRYREMALHPEVDGAIEDIINEAVVSDLYDSPVQIELSNLDASNKVKKLIREEFEYIKKLLNFDKKAHEIFRRWYVDGRLYYHKMIDFDDPSKGITEIRYVDPQKIRLVKEVQKNADQTRTDLNNKYDYGNVLEYYIYNPKGLKQNPMKSATAPTGGGIKIAKDAITFVQSGLLDANKGMVLSYLHKAIKALNQLRMIEDSLVIYRLSRAPERRIFYIDVGNLPKVKAEQYLREVMGRYRNKLVYDANTGEIKDDKKHMSMLEDFWLPRREGGRGTEISTLPGGQNLGELTDVEYFKKKLYRALNVPISRMEAEGGFNLGRSSEILRDEIKFTKFVGRLRKKFSEIFIDMLKTQLILKGITSVEEWEDMKEYIQFDFIYDNHFSELKESELLQERINLASAADPYVGKYFSVEYVRSKILHQTDTEMDEMDDQIEKEKDAGIIPPSEEEMMAMQQGGEGGALGDVPMDPEADGSATEPPEGQGLI
ncbi:portal vertex protein of head [Synechococcus phage S-BM3]|uniref:Portal protein n=1 Tax=Cyanophage S-BnM1 TaxID=65016 RepID=O36163_9CAUD|nr:T4gp20 homolog [Cyanophage S-BnM1]WDS61249.1 portal vertex protein of head [Synechococcus phage S-BM3]